MIINKKLKILILLGLIILSSDSYSQKKQDPINRILFVFDASQSMLGRWQSGRKIDIAKQLLTNITDSLKDLRNLELALRVYGHQRSFPPQDCDDTRLEINFIPSNIFAERVNGKFELRRGFKIQKNQKILIVEDVITTGKSSLECADMINKHHGNVIGYACIIDRSNDKSLIKKDFVSQIKIQIPTYNKDELPDHLKKINPIKPGSRNL